MREKEMADGRKGVERHTDGRDVKADGQMGNDRCPAKKGRNKGKAGSGNERGAVGDKCTLGRVHLVG